jgi:hypothetical protein
LAACAVRAWARRWSTEGGEVSSHGAGVAAGLTRGAHRGGMSRQSSGRRGRGRERGAQRRRARRAHSGASRRALRRYSHRGPGCLRGAVRRGVDVAGGPAAGLAAEVVARLTVRPHVGAGTAGQAVSATWCVDDKEKNEEKREDKEDKKCMLLTFFSARLRHVRRLREGHLPRPHSPLLPRPRGGRRHCAPCHRAIAKLRSVVSAPPTRTRDHRGPARTRPSAAARPSRRCSALQRIPERDQYLEGE